MVTKTALPLRSRERKQVISSQTDLERLAIRRILVPLDFSPASFNALDFAIALAERFRARVHLGHVFDLDCPFSMMAAMPVIIPESRLAESAKGRLKDVARRLALSRQNVHVVSGRTYHAICKLAGKLEADLIVTAANGQSALQHVLLGSTAERIVQHAPCPTLVVRGLQRSLFKTNGEATAGRPANLKKILVPLDFSNCSMVGVEYAVRLAEASGAELALFNSVSLPSFAPYGVYGDRGLSAAKHAVWLTAEKQISDLRSKLVARGIGAEIVVEAGVPAHQICLYAQNHEVDLIVVATHGSTGVKHSMLGTTVEQVVRHGPCPVLVVPCKKNQSSARRDLAVPFAAIGHGSTRLVPSCRDHAATA